MVHPVENEVHHCITLVSPHVQLQLQHTCSIRLHAHHHHVVPWRF
ncbi:hypothetical protein L915_18915 [Phytophthora nicotianae]|uniref:Uncharacterized protein n=1 Tax=Phytophthora nicotianae TaxID=4792 RepID=W2I2J6_PHYNI|nr:hypothetical protein L915_18915 [Phytophthora nicotianae]ETL27672.1 hypothetical protein L916_18813 [Phytophthora nicotianae]